MSITAYESLAGLSTDELRRLVRDLTPDDEALLDAALMLLRERRRPS